MLVPVSRSATEEAGYEDLDWEERIVIDLRSQGFNTVEIARKMRIPAPRSSVLLFRAVRKLGQPNPVMAAAEFGWPDGRRATINKPPVEQRVKRISFALGDTVHRHTEAGVQRGKLIALNAYVCLLADGREWQRRRVHPGRDC